jgi:hypothetical protein
MKLLQGGVVTIQPPKLSLRSAVVSLFLPLFPCFFPCFPVSLFLPLLAPTLRSPACSNPKKMMAAFFSIFSMPRYGQNFLPFLLKFKVLK